MKLYLKTDSEWLYPDEELLGTTCYTGEIVDLHVMAGSSIGIQMLATDVKDVEIHELSNNAGTKVNLLREVTVNFNTGEELKGFGSKSFVYLQEPDILPKHCTRKAPFRVYDAYKHYEGEKPQDGRIAFYVVFDIEGDQKTKELEKQLVITDGEMEICIPICIHVYEIDMPSKRKLSLTNWFSISNVAKFHNLELYSEQFFAMLENYADAMKYMHQTHFLLSADIINIVENHGKLKFDFTILERVAKIFFSHGLQVLEFGPIGTRKRVHYEELNVLGIDDLVCDSEKGKEALSDFFEQFAEIASRNGFMNRIVFHIADEPDEPETAIARRMEQYSVVHSIMRKSFPNARVCEAVKTAKFKDYIDILVPLSKTYEEDMDEFDVARNEGKDIWFYTCCVPTGNYYQRFLDVPLLSGRMLFWGASKFDMTGYLHWGFNLMEPDQHPFTQTNQYHTYGDGVCLPAGDSHIIYPDGNDIYYSLRMETYRKGCDDYELLELLKEKDYQAYMDLVNSIVESFHGEIDITKFNMAQRELLRTMCMARV